VPYTISGAEAKSNEKVGAILATPMDIFLPIGTLSVSANRESLTSDRAVVAKLHKILEEVYDELKASLGEELKSLTSGWEKMVYLNSVSSSFSGLVVMYAEVKKEVLRDTNLFGSTLVHASDFPNLIIRKYYRTWESTKSEDLLDGRDPTDGISLTSDNFNFIPNKDQTVEFILVDRTFGGDRLIRDYISSKEKSFRFIAISPSHPQQNATKFDMVGYLAEADKFIKAVGSPKWELLSRLNIPKKEKEQKVYFGPTYRSWIWRGGSDSWTRAWEARQEALPKDGIQFYVRTDRGKVLGLKESSTPALFTSMINNIKSLPFSGLSSDTEIYNFSKSEGLPKRTNATWVNLLDHIVEKIKDYLSDRNNLVVDYENKNNLRYSPGIVDSDLVSSVVSLPESSPFKKAVEIYHGVPGGEKRVIQTTIFEILSVLEDTIHYQDAKKLLRVDTSTVPKLISEMRNRYILLKGKDYYRGLDSDLVFFYIKTVDEQKELEAMYEASYDEGSRVIGLE
jgi:hypothetical protein